MSIIQDARTGKSVAIDVNNRLLTNAFSESVADHATEVGDKYNINTGTITLTTACESSVLYIKNNECVDIVVTAFIYNIGNSYDACCAIVTGCHFIDVYRNPTTGTVVCCAVAVDAVSNMNYGSTKVLCANVFKGAEGTTLTNGDFSIGSIGSGRGRTVVSLGAVHIPKSQSIGVKITPPTGNVSMKINIASSVFVFSTAVSGVE